MMLRAALATVKMMTGFRPRRETLMPRLIGVATFVLISVSVAATILALPDEGSLVPESLEPFEQLIGPWRVHGFLEADKLKGWDEPTAWGWLFEKGKIIGMEVTFKGGKYFSSAKLEPLEADGQYRFKAVTTEEKEFTYEGALKGKRLTLVRKESDSSAPDQVTLELLHDVRYQMLIEAKKSGTLVKKIATIGATRADVRFGAASKEEQGPKCIITGAPGTSTVSFNGQAYYVCCSGCAAEFKHDPEKWLKLAKEGKAKKGGDDGTSVKVKSKESAASKPSGIDSESPDSGMNSSSKPASKDGKGKTESEPKSAASLLSRAKLLEKNGKTDAAIQAYERLLKVHPKAPEAKDAESRLKELKKDSDAN
jgi:hypothetical protein